MAEDSIELVPASDVAPAAPVRERNRFDRLSDYIEHAGNGERAALARMDWDNMKPHQLAALARALVAAGMQPEQWRPDRWPRWALVAHGIALAGHDRSKRLGYQMAKAGIAESRVSRLLTSRGESFSQNLPRILRLMVSKGARPNWRELGELVIAEGSPSARHQLRAEEIRLQIAGTYFPEMARAEAKS
jgi:CRISPR system Cascade subunit CasB